MSIMKKAGILLISALALAALVFMGCQPDPEPEVTKVPLTWSDVSIEELNDSFWGIAYGNGVFVASTRSTGNDAPNHVYWSVDGVTWTEATTDYQNLMTNNKKQTTAFLNDKFVIFEGSSNVNNNGKWIQSTDGKTWTQARTDAPIGVVGAAYAGGNYIFGGQGGKILAGTALADVVQVSDQNSTGINWINGLAFGNSKVVATGMKGQILYASPTDLATWTAATITGGDLFSEKVVNQVVFGNGIFIAVGGTGNGQIGVKSSDGITWTQTGDLKLTPNIATDYTYIGYGAGVFVVGDASGYASYSTDNGESWTPVDSPFNSSDAIAIQGFAYGSGKFVMVGPGGKIACSIPE
jgi:hypothetical protein